MGPMTKKPTIQFSFEQNHVRVEAHEGALVNRLFGLLLALIVFFNIIDLTFNYQQSYPNAFRDFCNLAREDSLAAWFSSFSLLLAASLVWLIVIVQKAQKATRFKYLGWIFIALFFTYLGIDDATELHESVGTSFAEYFRTNPESKQGSFIYWLLDIFPSYNWQILFLPFFFCMAVFLLFFLWQELGTLDLRLSLILALGCFSLAVGLDYFEGRTSWHDGVAEGLSISTKSLKHYQRMLEESLELLGAAIFFRTFLSHFIRISGSFSVKFLRS